MDINARLKDAIRARGLNLSDVAAKMKNERGNSIGFTQSAMSHMLKGNIPFSRVEEICSIIGITLAELISGEYSDNCAQDFMAMIRRNGSLYCINSEQELKQLMLDWESA